MNEKVNWWEKNKKSILFLVIGLIIGALIMRIMWPKPVAKLENGEEVIAEVKDKKFTANDLYEALKVKSGIAKLTDLIDYHILRNKYDLDEKAKEEAKKQAETIYESYQSYYGYTKEEFLSSNNFASEQEFLDELVKEYYFQEYVKDYLEENLTDKEMQKYYDEKVFGEKEVYVFSSTDDENDLENVRKYLKNGKTLDDIKKKYSKITATSANIKYTDTTSYSDEVLKQVKNTSKGKYSKVFDDSTYGHLVIYVVSEKETPKFDDVKQEIIDTLVTKKQQEDETEYYKAFIKLRSDNDLKFLDKEMEKEYKESIKGYK